MVNFKLFNPKKKNGERSIYLFFYYQGNKNPFKWNTKLRILEKNWDKKKGRAKMSSTYKEGYEINEELSLIEVAMNSVFKTIDHRTNNSELKFLIEKELNIAILEDKNISFVDFAKKDNERLKPSTKKTWDSTVSVLESFQSIYGALNFQSFDNRFYDAFKDYCMDELNYANSTFSTRISNLKNILTRAEDSYDVNPAYKKFKTKPYKSFSVYLTIDEIKMLLNYEFREKELEYVRDLFVIRCYVGTRFGDSQLSRSNFTRKQGVDLLVIFNNKTGNYANVPIHPTVRLLMEKYDWNLKSIHINNFNAQVKTVCRIAGLTQKVSYGMERGGKVVRVEKEKWELIASHTARRTVATNMYLSNIPLDLILPITGHSNTKQLMTYIKADGLQKAIMASKYSYYTE